MDNNIVRNFSPVARNDTAKVPYEAFKLPRHCENRLIGSILGSQNDYVLRTINVLGDYGYQLFIVREISFAFQ